MKNDQFINRIERAANMLNTRKSSELESMYIAMENMYRSYWTLPSELADESVTWVHRVTSTDPHDAVRAGTRTLATVAPKVSLMPTFANQETRDKANQIEKALEWVFELASRRPATPILRDVVLSALLYDEIIVGTWYLPYQIELMKNSKQANRVKRLEAARRYGDWIIRVYNPRDAIVEYSDLMAERVLLRRVVTVQELVDMWGDQEDQIRGAMKSDEHQWATIYDYHEIGHRTVWAYVQDDVTGYSEIGLEGSIKLVDEPTPYDFLPIAAKVGGTTLADEERYKRIPLLWSLFNSGQWETQNILETLLASEGLAYSVSPRYAVENEFDADTPEMDFRNPARIVTLKRGQRLQDLRPPQLNSGLEILADRVAQRIDKSTVPRVLQSGDFPGGAAFASLNLATQSGMKSLTPYKELAEQVLADMFINILNWIDHTGDIIESYSKMPVVVPDDQEGLPTPDFNAEVITVGKDDFDVTRLYLQVRLTEDVPTDYMQKINAGAMLVERLQGSYQQALEFIGENDPQSVMKLRKAENIALAENQAETQRIMNETSLENMQLQDQLQQQIQQVQQLAQQLQEVMAQAQQGQPGQGAPGMGAPGMGAPGAPPMGQPAPDGSISPDQQAILAAQREGNPNAGVFPGSNPAEGDMPPATAAPGMGLREGTQEVRGE